MTMQNNHEYLVAQLELVQEIPINNYRLNFNHPVKELLWDINGYKPREQTEEEKNATKLRRENYKEMYKLENELKISKRKITKLRKIYRKTWCIETKTLLENEEINHTNLNGSYWNCKYYKYRNR